jgi:HD-like signal output (HDOD) protein/CheY-like chemotaxis protein
MTRILFVDDEPRMLAGLRRLLRSRQRDWTMHFVDGAEAALDLMDREPVDVIVSDFRMPGLDGGQLLAEVRRRHPDTARLILSGQAAEKDMIRVISIAHQFLTKPCRPEDLVAAVERALRLRHELGGDRVRATMAGLDTFLMAGSVLHELLEALESPESDVGVVARVLEKDPGLSARVLRHVNSLLSNQGRPVTSLEDALAEFGVQTIRSLALWDEIVRSFSVPDDLSGDWLARLNAHALETAQLARRLAAASARDDAFCAGLLHECGQLVFAVCRPDVFAAHLRLRDRDARLLVELERETFGVSHAQAGAYLLSSLGFPQEMVEATARHAGTQCVEAAGGPGAVSAVGLAHCLVEAERIRLCSPPGNPGLDDAALELAGILGEVWAWRTEQLARKKGNRVTALLSRGLGGRRGARVAL